MSWLPKNYDKVALGTATLVALVVGYSVFSAEKEVSAPRPVTPNDDVAIPQREILSNATDKFFAKYEIEPKQSDGIEVQSFVSFPLYSIKGKPGIQSLTDDYEMHPGLPLKMWKQYDLKDYEFSDGPELDADKDGFTNREEFLGQTDPTDEKSHPNFIDKLRFTGDKGIPFEMSWTKVNAKQGSFSFNYDNKRIFYGQLGVGGKFPDKAKDKSLVERFEIIGQDQDPDIPGENGEYYLLQDNGELQNKRTFKLYYRKQLEMKDWSASFLLDIPGAGGPFVVPEGGSFSLPYDQEAQLKPYTFKSKNGKKAEIEYEVDGKKFTVELDIPETKNN
jgi:hypothetical protein